MVVRGLDCALDAAATTRENTLRVSASGLDDNEDSADPSAELGLVDIHSHLLPGIDDGCRDAAESLECARRLAAAGVTHLFCTPHISGEYPNNNLSTIPAAVAQLQAVLDEAGLSLKLHPGGELRLGPHTLETPPDELLLMNLGQSRGGRFLLFDVWEADWPPWLDKAMYRLEQMRVTPIMAHPERCAFVCDDPLDAAERLADLGVLLQLNCYVLGGQKAMAQGMFSKAMRETADRLLEFDYYSFIAGDIHRAQMLDECVAALAAARAQIGEATFRRLAERNPMQILPEG